MVVMLDKVIGQILKKKFKVVQFGVVVWVVIKLVNKVLFEVGQ